MTSVATRTRLAGLARGSFPPLGLLYALLFGAFGAEAPFFPLFLQSKGSTTGEIALILTIGTIVRLSLGPVVGIVADRVGVRLALGCAAVAAGVIGTSYLAVTSFAALFLVSLVHASALCSLNPLSDALALSASTRERTFSYGWVRGIGSGSFVAATLFSGVVVAAFGLSSIIVVASGLVLLMAVPLPWLAAPGRSASGPPMAGVLELLSVPGFRRMLLVAGLVIGSQSMSDTFAAIHWRSAGVSPTVVGALWAEAVVSELLVFLLVGPLLVRRFGPGRCSTIGALAGIVQWGSLASTANPTLLALSQPLHGFTFALTHLAVMAVIAAVVPDERAATAQALYGTLCLGLASAAVTMTAGWLWAAWGARAFWTMSALCLAAVPLAATMRVRVAPLTSPLPNAPIVP